jgi:glycosyltransferase involved in cell wall biosynthesis
VLPRTLAALGWEQQINVIRNLPLDWRRAAEVSGNVRKPCSNRRLEDRIVPQRLAVFVPTLSGGGAERVTLHLAQAFAEEGYSVDLIVVRPEGEYQDFVPEGIRIIELGATRTSTAVLRLAAYLRRESPARLFSAMEDANVIALIARLLSRSRVPIVCAIHNTLSQHFGAERSCRNQLFLKLARIVYPWANAVVAVSEGAAEDARDVLGLGVEKVTVISNPVLTPSLVQRAAQPVDHPWFAPGAPPVILACGRLTPQKDYPTLLRAFASLRARARLVILGEGEDREKLQRLANKLGIASDVDFAGFVPNPYAFMARCAVYALSSLYEGSPVVLVEALACGCRIVATDCPSGPVEILRDVPGTVLVPISDANALARSIDSFLASNGPPPGPRVLARFDYRVAALAYLRVAQCAITLP